MLKNRTFLPFLLLTALGFAGCAQKKTELNPPNHVLQSAVIPFVGSFKVNRYVLDNGLRLLVLEDHSSPTFAYETWFKVGSHDELAGHTGLAHLFEHLMFKGTTHHPEGEFDKLLEAAGAEGENAFTSRDYTAYVQELPKDKLALIASLESDRMVNLVVNEKSFRTELEVVQNERRFRNENSPDGIMYQDIFGLAFTKHPYHWPVIGYQKDLEAMSAQDAENFYRSYYSPNHATIIIVGDVDPTNVVETIEKYYGSIPGQAAPSHTVETDDPQTAAKHETLKLNIQVDKLLMGYRVPDILNTDVPALEVVQTILTGGKSSRLSRALVDTGIADSVDAYDIDDKDPSLFIFQVNLQKGKRPSIAEAAVLREIGKLAKQLVPDAEIERAKNRLQFNFFEGLGSNGEKARFMGHFEAVANDFRAGLQMQAKTQTVTAADIQAVVKRYLDPKNRSVITGVRK
jgi:zinc protease